jgi:metal-responsive CopG/Arc/MetJ family transcriptional regulator
MLRMSTRNTKSVTVSLPPQLVPELDRVSERERRTRSEILRDALRRYITVAERGRMIPIEEALPEEIEAMRRADEEYVRGECVRLEDLRRELGLRTR